MFDPAREQVVLGVDPGVQVGDLVVFDRADRWTVADGTFRSRGRNTPLMGVALPGRVLLTIVRGRLAWQDPGLD